MMMREIGTGRFVNFDTVTNIRFDGYSDADEELVLAGVTIEFIDGGCIRPTLTVEQLWELYDTLQDM